MATGRSDEAKRDAQEPGRALVLGAGMVGSVMAIDLARNGEFEVTIADRSPEALNRMRQQSPAINTAECDLADARAVKSLVSEFDIVLGALPSTIGFESLRAVIEAGRNYCDISFMPEDALVLDDLAKSNGVTVVVDNGVAPGMSNMLTGYAETQLDEIEDVRIYVGGLPVERRWPFQYKAGFAPSDVIEEYTRPARFILNGAVVEREALSDPELIDFDRIGTLEAVNTDGLRSLIRTINARNMIEKTLRYPGHYDLMRAMRHTGLFGQEPINVGNDGVCVRPIDMTAALLFPQWKYNPGEADLTVMRVVVAGIRDGERVAFEWNLFDRLDPETGFTSMSRTTAFPNTIVARMVARGDFNAPGVHPPESLGRQPGILEHVLEELAERHVVYDSSTRIG